MSLGAIKKDGFLVKSKRPSLSNVSLISLRNSLQAYSRTYSSVIRHLNEAATSGVKEVEISDEDGIYNYSVRYIDYACSAITNFHHFCELVIKDILTKIHPLMAVDAANQHAILHQLLLGEDVAAEEIDSLQQIEFSKAHERLQKLIAVDRIPIQYVFIAEYKEFLQTINYLRNRIVHRGVYILNYKALDELFAKHALPFMFKVLSLEDYNTNNLWRPKPIHLNFDPLSEISSSWPQGAQYPFQKIALLKELTKAAYELPGELKFNNATRKYKSLLSRHESERIEKMAELIKNDNFGDFIASCPVCSFKSLVVFEDAIDHEHGETGQIIQEPYIYAIKCAYCTFDLFAEVEPIPEFNLPIPNYWERSA
jgi:hypothetical protein